MRGEKCLICENDHDHCKGDDCVFVHLNEDETAFLNKRKAIVNYHNKDIIKRKVEKSSIIFFCAGFAKVFLYGYYSKKFLVEIICRNSFINPPLNQIESNQKIIAMTDSRVCNIDLQDIIYLGERNGKFATAIWMRFNSNSSNYLARFSSIALKHTRGKLADALLYIEKNFKDINIYKMLTRKDIADLANISNENAIRTLNEFEKDGIISNDKKVIEIINHQSLLKISKMG